MKKLALVSMFAFGALIGCVRPSDQLCLEQQKCAGEDDPAKACQDAKDDLEDDAKACLDTCASESDAFATCALANGKCEDEVFDNGGDECADLGEASAECFTDCLAE